MQTVALLGTRYTMVASFFIERLEASGLKVLLPEEAEKECINRVIFDELCLGQVLAASRQQFLQIMQGLVRAGAEGIILACTEIGLLLAPAEDARVPLFDTTLLHAKAAVKMALA
jgi:aspartate racemase